MAKISTTKKSLLTVIAYGGSRIMANFLSYEWFLKKSKDFSRENLYELLNYELNNTLGYQKVLNIGAGGTIESALRVHHNLEIISIDIDSVKKPDIIMDVCNMSFNDSTFDIVVMMEVLEHVADTKSAVQEIFRVLRNGGKVLVSTPYILGIHEEPYDYYRFTKYGLIEIFKNFSEVSVTERNGYASATMTLFMRLIISKNHTDQKVAKIFILLSTIGKIIIKWLDRIIQNSSVTTGYFLVAKK